MTPRERILALSVGALVALMGGFYVLRQVQAGFQQRDAALQRLDDEKRQKERQVRLGQIALQRMNRYQEQSLPPNPHQARQLYTDWLLRKVTEVGFDEPKVNPITSTLRSRTDAFTGHAFSVSGAGSLEMLTRLMYEFYRVDYLHRIKSLQVTPRDAKTIAFAMTVDALSLPDAQEREALHNLPAQRLTEKEVAAYVDAICGRNMFGPPNNPPQLRVSSVTGAVNREVTIAPSASDPDKDDRLTYAWESADLRGARFDPQTGRLSWTPTAPGEYVVTMIVSDNGVPARSARQDVKITVANPPPQPVYVAPVEKKPPYQQVQFTYINGITEVDGERQVWMIDRRTGSSYWLKEGERFAIGEFQAQVKHIGPTDVEFEWYDQRALVRLGENLNEDKELEEGELYPVQREARIP